MPRVLRDELEGVDFYIAQGYAEIAHDTLERLREENGDHPEILARYKRLGASPELQIAEPVESHFEEPTSWPTLEPELEAVARTEFPSLLPEDEAFLEDELDAPSLDAGIMQEEPSRYELAAVEFAEVEAPHYEQDAAGFTEFETPHYEEVPEESLQVESPPYEQQLVEPREVEPFEGEPSRSATGPLLLQKESGALYPDLLVQFDTSELDRSHFEALQAPVPSAPPPPAQSSSETGDLIDSIMSGLDTSFDAIHYPREESLCETSHSSTETAEDTTTAGEHDTIRHVVTVGSIKSSETLQPEFTESIQDFAEVNEEVQASTEPSSARDELQEIFDELKEQTGDLKPLLDFETHYSLGLAYKDMDLLDDAISEFQMAFRTAGIQDLEGDYIHCCNMLGVCFKRKQMHKVAIMWFERGLKITGRAEDEYQALRFEIGLCYEEMGEIEKALESFTEVYGIDVNYRKVGEKIKQLQAAQIA